MARITARWLVRGGINTLRLSQSEALVLLAVIEYVDRNGVAWPSQYTLASELGIARSTVQASLGRLVDTGALIVEEQGRQGRSTRYRVGEQLARSPGRLHLVN